MDPPGPLGALVLEVTEGVLLDDDDHVTAMLAELKTLGVRLALDDFGTGYSSMTYLQRLPFDIVKIDQTFVVDLGRTPPATAIVTAVAQLAHALGLHVTAEGVETARQRDEIVAIGCESAQGHFYAPPMSAGAISVHLSAGLGAALHLPRQRLVATA